MKNEKIKNFFKSLRPNRAVYITAVTLLVALAVIISITVAANRSKKNNTDKQTEVGMATLHLGRMIHNSSWFVSFAKNEAVAPVGNIAQDMLCDAFRDGTLAHRLETRAKPTFTQEENDTKALSTTPMSTYLSEQRVLFITGDRPMDEWDAFVEEYQTMGNLEEVLNIYNNAKQNMQDTSTNIPEYPW